MVTFEIKISDQDGKKIQWRTCNRDYHRFAGYAVKIWYASGQKDYEAYWVNGKWHRTDGPAVTAWYASGQKHYEEYWVNDKLHRTDGPARTGWYDSGQKQYEAYWKNGCRDFRHPGELR